MERMDRQAGKGGVAERPGKVAKPHQAACSPPQQRRGGCAIKKSREATLAAQTGWCWSKNSLANTTPSAPPKEAPRCFLDVASTPPLLRSGLPSNLRTLIASLF